MRNSGTIATLVAVGALAACTGKGVNELASSITYNVPYVGQAVLGAPGVIPTSNSVPLTATLSMSQIASSVTGTIVVTQFTPAMQDTLLSAGLTGHTTPTGLDLTIVQPSGCAMHLSGPLVLEGDRSLAGTLTGSDCHATGADNLQLTLTLARQ